MSKNHANFSHWETNRELFKGDILIIGSGLVGQSIGIAIQKQKKELKQKPLKICIVDKLPMGQSGASTRNAGFACFGSPTEILDDLSREEENQTVNRISNRISGLSIWKDWIPSNIMEWNDCGGYEVFEREEEMNFQEVLDKLPYLNKIGKAASGNPMIYSKYQRISSKLPYSIRIEGEASLNPGKAHNSLYGLNKELGNQIVNGVSIPNRNYWHKNLEGWTIPTENGIFKAKRVVIAANAWTPKILDSDIDITPGRGQILMIKSAKPISYKGVFHAKKGYLYFRNINNSLIIGGGRNLFQTHETSLKMTTTKEVQDYLELYARDVLLPNQDFSIQNRWAGIMAFSKRGNGNKDPLLYWDEPDLLIASRMCGMGIALAPTIGIKASKKILE
jgi:glycine/D-amino acid oxidase-like deaminating enzyme